jgi:hypothetical protein
LRTLRSDERAANPLLVVGIIAIAVVVALVAAVASGVLNLEPGASCVATGTVSGLGSPLSGATVKLTRSILVGGNFESRDVDEDVTGFNGAYSVSSGKCGVDGFRNFHLLVSAPGFESTGTVLAWNQNPPISTSTDFSLLKSP